MPIALVTGGGRGIGLQVVHGLARLGFTCLLGAREPQRAREATAELNAAGHDVRLIRLDVTDAICLKEAAASIGHQFGRLDVLVNNAGIAGDRSAQIAGRVDLAVVREVFETNVFGVIAATEAFLPLLRESACARVVNVSSSVGSLTRMSDPEHYFTGIPGSVAYPPSKAALNQVTVQYAKQLREEQILVNAADPGPCATDFTEGISGVTRTAADGAAIIISLATLPDDGPTGGYLRDTGPVPW